MSKGRVFYSFPNYLAMEPPQWILMPDFADQIYNPLPRKERSMATKRTVDLYALLNKMTEEFVTGEFSHYKPGDAYRLGGSFLHGRVVDICTKLLNPSDASSSSPEHRAITGMPVELTVLKERVEKVERMSDELLSQFDRLATDVDAVEKSSVPLNERVGTLAQDVLAHTNRLDAQRKWLDESGDRLAALEASVKALEKPDDPIKDRVDSLEKRMGGLSADVSLIQFALNTRLIPLEESVAELKHPAKYDPTRPPAPLPPPAPEGYEHLDPPAFRVPLVGERFMADSPYASVQEPLERFPSTDYQQWEARWIVRPKPVAAAAPKQDREWRVNEVAEFSAFRGVVRSPIGLIEGGFAYFYDSERGWQITKKVPLADLRRPGGAA